MRNEIINGDAFDILPTLPDKSFDAVIIDPPYGMGIDKWDVKFTPEEISFFTEHIKRVGKGFYAVFGQMPYIADWHNEAIRHFSFIEDVVWVKRNPSIGGNHKNLKRTHEHIYIYTISNNRNFYNVKGRYEDIAIPNLCHDIMSLHSIYKVLSDLRLRIKRGYGNVIKAKELETICHTAHSRKTRVKDYVMSGEYRNYTNVWSFLRPSHIKRDGDHKHPTMKPELLIMRLVELLTNPGMSVLDFFSGSGVVAIACKRLNREFLCIEKERKFYEHSVEWLECDVWQPEISLDMN